MVTAAIQAAVARETLPTLERIRDDRNCYCERSSSSSWLLTLSPSAKRKQLRAFGRIARMTKISNAPDPVTHPLQQNKVRRRPRWIARIAHERCRVPVYQPWNEMPVADQAIIMKVPS